MRTLEEHLSQYGAYHRDPRNIATHFVGIPMIVLSVAVLLARPTFAVVASLPVAPVILVALFASAFYLRLDLRFGLFMSAVMAANAWVGLWFATQSTAVWAASGVGLFVVGWTIQFIGHYFEGKKPAFVDDLVGLIVGPLFVTAEVAFAIGLRHEVKSAIEAKVGPTRINPDRPKKRAGAATKAA
jgi:uncharacterized membrane protein YGL010W